QSRWGASLVWAPLVVVGGRRSKVRRYSSSRAPRDLSRATTRRHGRTPIGYRGWQADGPQTKLTAHQQRSARIRLANGESTRDIAKDFTVHHATIARLR